MCFAVVAFTFDDGPYIYTSDLLHKLNTYNAKATIFISKHLISRTSEYALTCDSW